MKGFYIIRKFPLIRNKVKDLRLLRVSVALLIYRAITGVIFLDNYILFKINENSKPRKTISLNIKTHRFHSKQ